MGCSPSTLSNRVMDSGGKVDVGTNTSDNDSLSDTISEMIPMPHLLQIPTRTDPLEFSSKPYQTISSLENSSEYFNIKSNDKEKIFDNDNEISSRHENHWILNDSDAKQYSINNQIMLISAGQITPSMVVDAIEQSGDLQTMTKTVRNLLNSAKTTGDTTYLIRAYTAKSDFNQILNQKLSEQILDYPIDLNFEEQLQTTMWNVFTQFGNVTSYDKALEQEKSSSSTLSNSHQIIDWSILYLQSIYRLTTTPKSNLRYQGRTYSTIRLTLKELERYKSKPYICNKILIITSKLRSVALEHIGSRIRTDNTRDVTFIYSIDSFSSLLAIDIQSLSLTPNKQQVLLLPGILFAVETIKYTTPNSIEINLRSAFNDLKNSQIPQQLNELLDRFQSDIF